jgi:hypothetical protein
MRAKGLLLKSQASNSVGKSKSYIGFFIGSLFTLNLLFSSGSIVQYEW